MKQSDHGIPTTVFTESEARFIHENMMSSVSIPVQQHYWLGFVRGTQRMIPQTTPSTASE